MPPSPAAPPSRRSTTSPSTTKKFIVVLNDNEWSHRQERRRHRRYFNALATHPTYAHVRDKAADFVEKVVGKAARNLAHKVEESAKNLLTSRTTSSVLFEKFGLRYYGPIDGHDLPLLIRTFELLKNAARARRPPHHHRKRPRLPTRARQPGQIPRPRDLSRSTTGSTAVHRHADLLGHLRPHRHGLRRKTTKRSSPSPPPCPAAPGW